jgi:outer membrane protein assembly factor BamE (lipoprotein component of BamABCDE complex)
MNLRLLPCIVVLALVLAGCASGGNDILRTQDANTVNQYIIDGKTTRNEIEKIYGPPSSTSFADAQTDIWIYRWARATAKAENFVPYVGAFVGGRDVQQKELVILFNAQNVVVRHSMRDSTEQIRRNLSASAAPTASTGQVSTSPAPPSGSTGAAAAPAVAAAAPATPSAPRPPARAAAAAPTVPAPTASSIETGRWTCGMRTTSDRRYALNFTVAADRSITVGNYGNAPATVVKTSPLTFTAVNPRGDRVVTFTMQADNSLVMTGPSNTNSNATFYDEGTCVKGAGAAS